MGQFCNGDIVAPMTSQRTDDHYCSFAGETIGQTVPLRDNGSKFRKVLLIGPVRARGFPADRRMKGEAGEGKNGLRCFVSEGMCTRAITAAERFHAYCTLGSRLKSRPTSRNRKAKYVGN